MPRVYLLLRNNRESGPFTIGELLQQQLKPTDLVWVEGRSENWRPFSEMEMLPPDLLAELPSKKHFDSPSFTLQKQVAPAPVISTIENSQEEEAPVSLIDHRQEKSFERHETISGIFVTLLVAAAVLAGKTLFFGQKQNFASASTNLVSKDMHAAHKPNIQAEPAGFLSQPVPKVVQADMHDTVAVAVRKPLRKKLIPVHPDSAVFVSKTLTQNIPEPLVVKMEKTTEPEQLQKTEEKKEPATTTVKNQSESPKTEVEPEEKKKGIGGLFRGLFKKKKKADN